MQKAYAHRIAKLRGEKSQRELAKDLKLSNSAIAMYESGKRVPKDAVKQKIADYFGTTVQAIFFD